MKTVAGVDAHGETFTVAVASGAGRRVDDATFPNDSSGWRLAERFGADHGVDAWAVEGTGSYGRSLSDVLIGAGHVVYEVPTRMTVRQRRRHTASKSDEIDALACARAGLASELPVVIHDPHLEALRVTVRARQALVRHHIETQGRVRAWIGEINPVLARDVKLSRVSHWEHVVDALGAATGVHERAVIEVISGEAATAIARIARINELEHRLGDMLPAQGRQLVDSIVGIGIIGAATILAETGNVNRFKSESAFAMWAASAPLDAGSAGKNRHRYNPRGNRSIDHVLEIAIRCQRSHHADADTYITRRIQAGNSYKEASRALKRHLIRKVYRTLKRHQPQTH